MSTYSPILPRQGRSRRRSAVRAALTALPTPVVPVVGLVTADLAGQAAIAARLPGSAHVSLASVAMVAIVLLGVFHIAERARGPESLLLTVPAGALGVIGHLVDVRMRAGAVADVHAGQALAAVVFSAMLVALADRGRMEALAPLAGYVGVALIMLPLLPVVGDSVGHQHVNAGIGPLHGQPGELGRPLVLVGMAAALGDLPLPAGAKLAFAEVREQLGVALMCPVLAVGVTALCRDMGPAVLLAVATVLMVLSVTGRRRHVVLLLACLVLLLTVGALVARQRITERFGDVLAPMDFAGSYDQAALARMWMAWGNLWGVGLGGGIVDPQQGGVPESASDMVLVSWAEETGLAGLMACVLLACAVVWALFTFAKRAEEGFWRLGCTAMACLMACQIGWVVAATAGLLPLTGISFPLVATGRSAAVGMAFACAFALRAPADHLRARLVRGVDPRQMIGLLRVTVVGAIAFSAVFATATVLRDATRWDRLGDHHPIRGIVGLARGPIRAAGGERLAYSTGLSSIQTYARRYTHPELADIVGRTRAGLLGDGLEGAWSSVLRCAGSGQATDPAEPVVGVRGDPARCRPAGLQLSLDLPLQRAAVRALGDRAGAVVVMDPRTGAILALAGAHPGAPRAANLWMAGLTAVAPGSTFKLVTAAAALQSKVPLATPTRTTWQLPDGGFVTNAGGERCGGTLATAIASSCNTSIADLALRIGATHLSSTADALGYGRAPSLSGLPVAPAQTFGYRALARVSPTALAMAGFGQGTVTATPVQTAVLGAAVANGGRRVTPGLVAAVCDGDRVLSRPQQRVAARRAMSSDIATELSEMMRAVAVRGTARALRLPGAWAVKTGTSELSANPSARSVAGTAGMIVGFPTDGAATRAVVVSVMTLPDRAHPGRSGPVDGVAVLQAVGRTAMAASARAVGARCRR